MRSLGDDILQAGPFRAFLGDMAALGVTPVASGGQAFAVVAARSNPRWWLLPLDSRRATAAGLEMLQPVTTAAGLAKVAMRGLARVGPLGMLGRGQVRLSGLPDLSGAFDGQAAHMACFTGTEGPHRKTALQVMDKTGGILGYAKLSRAAHVRTYVRNEAKVLRQLAGMGLASADVPRVLSLRDDAALTLLVTDSLKSASHSAPRQPGPAHLRFLEELRDRTRRTGAGLVLDGLAQRMATLATRAGKGWTDRIARVRTALAPMADTIPVCLVHGDFTPWNSFLQGGRLYVFDWEYARPDWPVGFDLAHFLLATIPPDRQADCLPALRQALAAAHFGGDAPAAGRALLMSLACHAVFYLGRLDEADRPLADWADGPVRAAMIDRLMDAAEVGA
ncbi:aminoglycoside phosphotransferase family protein [Thetidibacter halocola]|uniref:Aminoglycoside phosphotransferase family protein n=1 Tax=Thetidibacter halocola TaxID=2827239 RepID=A0A8J7WH53_9RHOB|nr:aminoglycoside phosphotransferase family protein [Thetidibacter halocola]MBS0124929.1 aminoglycoside phosphotransferase family protein [Thetidibacter halocola]